MIAYVDALMDAAWITPCGASMTTLTVDRSRADTQNGLQEYSHMRQWREETGKLTTERGMIRTSKTNLLFSKVLIPLIKVLGQNNPAVQKESRP